MVYALGNNSANFNNCATWDGLTGNVTTVGSNGGPSAYGTYDQGGNVKEFIVDSTLGYILGASYNSSSVFANLDGGAGGSGSYNNVGFRIASSNNPLKLHFFVSVEDINNAANIYNYGSVSYSYQIAQYPVTNYEYAEFLNLVARTDTYFLYNTNMAGPAGGIIRNGSANNFTYTVKNNYGNKPVVYLTWFSAARYCNWLHNGKGSGSTETGAYNMSGAQENTNNAIAKNINAKYWIPTRNEWHKAAFYKAGGQNAGYWTFATQRDSQTPSCINANSVGDGPFPTSYFYYNTACNPTNVVACVTPGLVVPGQIGTKIGYLNWTLPANIDCSQFTGTYVRVYYSNMYPYLAGWNWVPFPGQSCPINVFQDNTQRYEIRLQNTAATDAPIYSSWIESNVISYTDNNSSCDEGFNPSPTPTSTSSPTPTSTNTPTPSITNTSTPTSTPSQTLRSCAFTKQQNIPLIDNASDKTIVLMSKIDNMDITPKPTPTITSTSTQTSTPTPTQTPTNTRTATLTPTKTASPTKTPTSTTTRTLSPTRRSN